MSFMRGERKGHRKTVSIPGRSIRKAEAREVAPPWGKKKEQYRIFLTGGRFGMSTRPSPTLLGGDVSTPPINSSKEGGEKKVYGMGVPRSTICTLYAGAYPQRKASGSLFLRAERKRNPGLAFAERGKGPTGG